MNDLERIKDRVRKLLALSKSDNENEAAAALEKANELIGKYRIDQDSLAFESVSVKTTKTYSPWRNIIANAVSYLYGCYKYKNTEGEFVFTGDPLYVFMAEEMYRYLTVTVERIAKAGIRRNAKYAYRQNFRLGVADRLYDRIMELNKKCSWAPEREAQSEAAEDFIKARIKLSSTAHRHKIKKRTAFNKGIAAGEGISLARQAGHSPVPQLASGRTARTVQGELF